VVVLTTFDDDDHLFPALAAGACGFLVKDAAPSELLAAIRTAAAGESPFSPAVLRRLVDRAVQSWQLPASASPLPATLTARERDVLALVAAGLSNKEIGDRLHMGVITVKTHVTSLLAKTGAANRIRLALLAVQARL
jgi:DNA-binding NarL/FixJ family response regulator